MQIRTSTKLSMLFTAAVHCVYTLLFEGAWIAEIGEVAATAGERRAQARSFRDDASRRDAREGRSHQHPAKIYPCGRKSSPRKADPQLKILGL